MCVCALWIYIVYCHRLCTCVSLLDVMLPMKLVLSVNCCRGTYDVSGDCTLETPYMYIFFVGMDDTKM